MHVIAKYNYLSLFVLGALLLVVGVGCDSSGSSDGGDAEVKSVAVTGTQVPADFQTNGEFGVSATPLDGGGNGIISKNLKAEVTIERNPSTASAKQSQPIVASVAVSSTSGPSSNPLAVPIVLDGSGSMGGSDPNRLRVDGANAFIDQLDNGSVTFEAAVFEFPGSNPANPDFGDTDFFAGFTSDVDSLKNGTAKAQASGGTPMYNSLAEILAYAEDEKPQSSFRKAIVLLADGQPSTFGVTRDSVCTSANEKNTPIFGIGLGPASDLADFPDPGAIAEMRGISDCTGGAYQGLSEGEVDVIQQAFAAAATGSAQGSVGFNVKIESGLSQFVAGDIVKGILTVTSGGSSANGTFTFRVPDASTSSSRAYQF
jgi:uncharacterized protein YegL